MFYEHICLFSYSNIKFVRYSDELKKMNQKVLILYGNSLIKFINLGNCFNKMFYSKFFYTFLIRPWSWPTHSHNDLYFVYFRNNLREFVSSFSEFAILSFFLAGKYSKGGQLQVSHPSYSWTFKLVSNKSI